MTYNPRKAAQTIAFFALKTGKDAINVLKAVKLVYLADRENIARFGFPILDERRVSMKNGPVNSRTYEYIQGEVPPDQDDGWSEFLRDRAGHDVGLVSQRLSEDDLDELSEAEIDTLEAVWCKFGHMTQWQLRDMTHDPDVIPEWEHPEAYGSVTIPLEVIFEAVGVTPSKEHAIEVENLNKVSRFLKGL